MSRITVSRTDPFALSDDVILRIFLDIAPIRDFVIDHSPYYISDLINQKDLFYDLVLRGISEVFGEEFPHLQSYGGTD